MLRTVSTFFGNLSSTRPDLLVMVKVLVLELATVDHHSAKVVTIYPVSLPLSSVTIYQRIPAQTKCVLGHAAHSRQVDQIATHHAYSCQPSFHDTDEYKIASELVTVVRAGHAILSTIEETESQMEPMVSFPSCSLDIAQDDTVRNVHDYNNPQNVLYEEPALHSLVFQIHVNEIIESCISSDHSYRKKTLSCVLK